MSNTTNIQWTDITDNIIRVVGGGWWCRMISEGCAHCYAAKLNQSSYFGGNKLPYTGDPPKMILVNDIIEGWARMTKSKKHFVASMTDIFGDWVSQEWADTFLDGMLAAPKQTFQMLTKRADVARDRINNWLDRKGLKELPAHMWIGASTENQKRYGERVEDLLKIRARVRFLSVEPMLSELQLQLHTINYDWMCKGASSKMPHIAWVIFGGESGPGARPCNVEWIRNGVQQCRAAGVPLFVKQLGANAVQRNGCFVSEFSDEVSEAIKNTPPERIRFEDPKGGDMAEWPKDLQIQEMPRL